MKRIDLLDIIRNGGATLDASGAGLDFRRGYQVSKRNNLQLLLLCVQPFWIMFFARIYCCFTQPE